MNSLPNSTTPAILATPDSQLLTSQQPPLDQQIGQPTTQQQIVNSLPNSTTPATDSQLLTSQQPPPRSTDWTTNSFAASNRFTIAYKSATTTSINRLDNQQFRRHNRSQLLTSQQPPPQIHRLDCLQRTISHLLINRLDCLTSDLMATRLDLIQFNP